MALVQEAGYIVEKPAGPIFLHQQVTAGEAAARLTSFWGLHVTEQTPQLLTRS